MRGDRQTFARGMAITTDKKLLLEGEDVAFRFFDSRLYELHRARGGQLPTAHLLAFKGERGRNPARVFAELFILPSGGKLDLDYLDLLNAHWVVDHATLAHGAARADAAKSILTETQAVSKGLEEEGAASL